MAVQFLKELPYQIGLAIRPGSIDLQIVFVNDIGEALQLGLIFVGVERRFADLEAKLMDMGSPSKICQFQDQKALLAEGNPRKIETPTVQLLPSCLANNRVKSYLTLPICPSGGEVAKSCSFFFNSTAG